LPLSKTASGKLGGPSIERRWTISAPGSALIAIALGEPSRERLLDALETAADRVLSAMSLLEAGIVLRARLNFGDCAVYALAVSRDEPVLATGHKFAATDLACYRL
jgi:uncharacterized protein with PIN domain